MILVIQVMKEICNDQMSVSNLGGRDSKINVNISFNAHFEKYPSIIPEQLFGTAHQQSRFYPKLAEQHK